ncbi:hypothetical protein WOLCODRAFT_138846, partial [Wolfiporia cocos MD-104 SS10]
SLRIKFEYCADEHSLPTLGCCTPALRELSLECGRLSLASCAGLATLILTKVLITRTSRSYIWITSFWRVQIGFLLDLPIGCIFPDCAI